MQTFSIRDLRERTGELTRVAEAGEIAVVAKHGEPVFLTVPFDEALLRCGLRLDIALKLYEGGLMNLGKAARFANMSQEAFVETLGAMGIPAVKYDPSELAAEVAALKGVSKNSNF